MRDSLSRGRARAVPSRSVDSRLKRSTWPEQPVPAKGFSCAGAPQAGTKEIQTPDDLYRSSSSPPPHAFEAETEKVSEPMSDIFFAGPESYDSDLVKPDTHQVSPGAERSRHSFRYVPYHLNSPHSSYTYEEDDEEEEHDQTQSDREAIRGCLQAYSNIIGRRVARALIDLIGIEPNPGPKSKVSASELQSMMGKLKRVQPVVKNQVVVEKRRPKANVHRNQERYLSGEIWNPRAEMAAYMLTLMDAEKHPPVRLGGETMIQTALTTLNGNFTYNVGTSSAVSFVVHPRLWKPLLISTQGATPYAYTAYDIFPTGTANQLNSLASGARIVSAKLKIFTLASATSDSGALVCGLAPRDDGFFQAAGVVGNNSGEVVQSNYPGTNALAANSVSSGGFPIVSNNNAAVGLGAVQTIATQGYNEFDSYDFTEVTPLKNGASVFWLPEDPQTMTFIPDRIRPTALVTVSATNSAATNTFINGSAIEDPFFVFGVQGVSPGTAIFIELFLNMEYTVTSGAAGVISTSSGSMNSLQTMEIVKKIGSNLNNTVEPSPDASLGDKLGNLAKSVARGGIGTVSKFLFGSSDIGDQVSDIVGFR